MLLLVGGRRESPDVVARLLDVEEVSSKPQYDMAEELPLVLHECGFENLAVEYQPSVLWALTAHYEAMWEEHMIAAARARNSLEFLLGRQLRSKDVKEFVEAKGVASVQMEASRMSWGAVLEALAAEGLHPTDPPKGAYIPLLQVSIRGIVVCCVLLDGCLCSASGEMIMRRGKPISLGARRSVWSGIWI